MVNGEDLGELPGWVIAVAVPHTSEGTNASRFTPSMEEHHRPRPPPSGERPGGHELPLPQMTGERLLVDWETGPGLEVKSKHQ